MHQSPALRDSWLFYAISPEAARMSRLKALAGPLTHTAVVGAYFTAHQAPCALCYPAKIDRE